MILTAHQPVYIPWSGLFHKIALADQFVSFNCVQYQSKDWNNRNEIKTPQGRKWLTVPVFKKGRLHNIILDTKIDNSRPWQRKHWRSLQLNYSKATFFKRYADYFEYVYSKEWCGLVDLNEYMLKWFLAELKINTKFLSAADYDFEGNKGDLVLDMCKKLGANKYIFGSQGENYAEKRKFMKSGVIPIFQNYNCPEYNQLHGGFEEGLSILDLLFNHGDDSFDILMSNNVKYV